ncbi:MAG: YdcF family protein [Anaerolineales bacterium]|nr:YdcF family protein [Anaerolineales bacterium]
MDLIAEFFKEMLIPGSTMFLMLGLIIGVILLFIGWKTEKWGKRWLLFLSMLYLVLSIPLTASLLERGLSAGYEPISSTTEFADVEAIVILGGGGASFRAGEVEVNTLSESSALRAMEGARLYQMLDDPIVIVSGGINPRAGLLTPESKPMRDTLVELGVPTQRILLESDSFNTHEQALNVPPMLTAAGIERFILVTSPTHMRRAYFTFLEQGLEPLPAISAQHSETSSFSSKSIVPDLEALAVSQSALREWMGLIYYTLRGWI